MGQKWQLWPSPLEFPLVKFGKSWQIGYHCFALRRARFLRNSLSQVIEEWQKHKFAKSKISEWTTPVFFWLKIRD